MEQTFTDNEIQVVVFKLGQEEYAVSILQVQEIKRMTDITRVPHAPEYIKGVMNLRGSVLPVLDLKKRLNIAGGELTDNTRIIIIKLGEITAGMIVDAVSEVMTIGTQSIEPPQIVVRGSTGADYLSGVAKVGGRLLIILDLWAIIGIGQDMAKLA